MIKVLIIKGIVIVYVSKFFFFVFFKTALSCGVLLVFSVFYLLFSPKICLYNSQNTHFTPVFFPLLRGVKVPSEAHF